jgi:hypothetical protein
MLKKLKTYSKSNDITSGHFSPVKLHTNIKASGSVTGYGSLAVEGDAIIVWGEALADETALDAIVEAHTEDLGSKRYDAKARLDAAAHDKRHEYLTEGQDLTYANKRKEAEAFIAAGSPEEEIDDGPHFPGAWPYVSSYKMSEGLANGNAAAMVILGKVVALSALDAEVENTRLAAKHAIDGALTCGEIAQITDDAVAALGTIEL